jgi:hypothetical protein
MSNVESEPVLEITVYDNVYVKPYDTSYKSKVDAFLEAAIAEGNDSYRSSKFHPENINGHTWMTFVGDELASISAVERSHYTGDPDIAGRVCRYHILKKFRHSNAGFRMLNDQVVWAKEVGLKVLYWTHDVNNKALNALYQHKRTMPFRGEGVPYFMTDTYKAFVLQPNMIFKVSQKSDFLQYVYANVLDPNYIWHPIYPTIIYYDHNGDINDEVKAAVLRAQH